MKCLLLMSGPSGVGKSTLASGLQEGLAFQRIASSPYLMTIATAQGRSHERLTLQEIGDGLDVSTDYAWIVRDVALPVISLAAPDAHWLVDSVRKQRQVERFRDEFGDGVIHIHLTASEELLRQRYAARGFALGVHLPSYDEMIEHPNEVCSRALGGIADLLIKSDGLSAGQTLSAVREELLRRGLL